MSTTGTGMTDDPRPVAGDEPEIVAGEVMQDATAAAFGGAKSQDRAAGSSGQGPAGDFGSSPAGAFGSGTAGGFRAPLGAMSVAGALRLLTDSSPELRSMLAAPLRLLTIAVLVPSLIAALFGLVIDGSAKFLAFAIAVCGGVAGALLQARRRRLIAVSPSVAPVAAPTGRPGRGGLKGTAALVAVALLVMMLAIGFDVLAVLLLVFNVW